MVPVEAMACGCPVVALAAGGALESVVGTGRVPTGVFFREASVSALRRALLQLEQLEGTGRLSEPALRQRAMLFSADQFRKQVRQQVAQASGGRLLG